MSLNEVLKKIKRLPLGLICVIFAVSICVSACSGTNSSTEIGIETDTEKVTAEPNDETSLTDVTEPTKAPEAIGSGEANPVEISSIPEYSGDPFVVINDNQPSFSSYELVTTAYETYSPLDNLGRCGMAVASCGKELMPTGERGEINEVYPSGWNQAEYDCVSGTYLYNRCHLIGWQLSGENANARNLITGTRYLNTEGMLPFENMVADYIKETGNHVAYRITPIYEGDNLVASGVQMEAYSIEDEGEGICFNIYCYNVQPQISINYSNGESFEDGIDTANNVAADSPQGESTTTSESSYVLNTNTKKFHYPDCSSVDQMNESNKDYFSGNRDELVNQGYDACKNCNP